MKVDSLRQGYFDTNIQTYCGVGNERTKLIGEFMDTLVNDDGVFHWSQNVKVKLGESNLPGSRNMSDKQLGLIGYFFKLGYELILLPNQDVSENPGFESFLGIYNNSTRNSA